MNDQPESEREWLIVGQIAKPHGVHGEIVAEAITDFPDRFRVGVTFGVGPDSGPVVFHEVHRVREHCGRWLFSVVGIREREPIESWRGQFLFLPALSREELPAGYYYEHELVGLSCVSPGGAVLGVVTGLDPDDTQTRLVVRRDDVDYLLPYVPAFVRSVDLVARRVVVDAPPGLLDDDAETV